MRQKLDPGLVTAGVYAGLKAHRRHAAIANVLTVLIAIITLPLIWPANFLFFVGSDPSTGAVIPWDVRLGYAAEYFRAIRDGLSAPTAMHDVLKAYYFDWVGGVIAGTSQGGAIWLIWIALMVVLAALGRATNRHSETPNLYGDARWATEADIEEMHRRDLIGFSRPKTWLERTLPIFTTRLKPVKLFVVGRFKKHLLRMGETLSVLVLAPPGTGKTAGFVVPSAVSMPEVSLFFHDQKPELFDMTSGHRATIGPVYQLKWSAQDEPDGTWLNDDQVKLHSPELLEHDQDKNPVRDEMGRWKTKPIFYPSWNPLSPKSIPAPGPKRDMYIERLVNVLCPDPSAGEKFWAEMARKALLGLVHYLVAKVEFATDPRFGGDWEGIPERWHWREASFPMLVDWVAYATTHHDDGSEDAQRLIFKAAVAETTEMDKKFAEIYGNSVLNRAVNELTATMMQPDKTRASIITTMDGALSAFQNEAVRQRTSHCDFAFCDLRGVPTPKARAREQDKEAKANKNGRLYKPRYDNDEFQPMSVYVSVAAEDAKAFAKITGVFVDSANAYLLTNGPRAIDDQGNQNGPFDFVFLIDEAPQLPKLDTVINGPSVGRSKRISYIIVGQDFGQFEEKYSRANVETLKSTTAVKVVLSQNNFASAREISDMAGDITFTKFHNSKPSGGGKRNTAADMLATLVESGGGPEDHSSIKFLKPSDIMSLPPNKHIVLVQNFMNRPIYADTPMFFLDPEIRARVYNLRDFSGPPPTTPMPKANMAAAEARLIHDAKLSPRHIIVVTPRDIQRLTTDAGGEMADLGKDYGLAAIQIPKDGFYPEMPTQNDVLVTADLEMIVTFIGRHRYFIFNKAGLEEELNLRLREMNQPPLPRDTAIFIQDIAAEIGQQFPSLYEFGFSSGAGLDPPSCAASVTADFGVRWAAEAITYIYGVKHEEKQAELCKNLVKADSKDP